MVTTVPNVDIICTDLHILFRCAAPTQRRKAVTPRSPINSKYDLFQQLFKAEGPSSEPASLDPLAAVLQSLRQPWDRPPSSKYDVFQAIFALEGPDSQRPSLDPLSALQQDRSDQAKDSVKSKYDPFQALFQSQMPTGDAALDPLPNLMKAMTASSLLKKQQEQQQRQQQPSSTRSDK